MRHIKRRITMLALLGVAIWSCNRDPRAELIPLTPSSMPFEGATHQKTWMAVPGNKDTNKELQENLILIASTIAQYEPVSIVVDHATHQTLLTLLGDLNAHHYPMEVLEANITSPSIRNEGPSFAYDANSSLVGIDFNHKNSVQKEEMPDANLTQFIISKTSAKAVSSNLHIQATCIEVDGAGTAMMTESCIVNDDINPDWEKEEIETELKTLLGLQKIIWLKGTKKRTIAARFVREGVVLTHRNNDKTSDEYTLTRENIENLQSQKDASGHMLKVIIIDAPKDSDKSYLGYYLCNNALIMQTFEEEEADYKAYKTLQNSFEERSIEQLSFGDIDKDIHAVTLQEPAL